MVLGHLHIFGGKLSGKTNEVFSWLPHPALDSVILFIYLFNIFIGV